MDAYWNCSRCPQMNYGHVQQCMACNAPRPRGQQYTFPRVQNSNSYSRQEQKAGPAGWSTSVCPDDQRRIVFLGRTGSGKSASGNNILGMKIFESSACGSSVTKKCQRGTAVRFGRNIQIIDSPGLFDTGMTNADVTREVVKCVGMTAPGPHAFVLVTRIDRFTVEEQQTVQHFMQVFGEGMVDYLLVLFTRKDDLIHENKTLAEYIQNVPQELKNLLQACHHRCLAFNNRGSASERAQDVKDFMEMIDTILMQNGGRCYTTDMFEEAERNIQQREEQLRKEHEAKREREREQIRREFESKMKTENKIHEFEAAQLQTRIREMEDKSKQSSADASKSLAQEIADLNSVVKTLADENEKVKKDLQEEQKRKEREAADKAREADREAARDEVNKEKPGVMGFLLQVLPHLVGAILPGIVGKVAGAAGAVFTKVFTRK